MPTMEEKERFAAQMRATPSQQEIRMAFALLRTPSVWTFQAILEGWIVDFYCEHEELIVEVDGTSHHAPEAWAKDRKRDLSLMRAGMSVVHLDIRAMEIPYWEDSLLGIVENLSERHWYKKPPVTLLVEDRLPMALRLQPSSDASLSIGAISLDTLWRDEFQPGSELLGPDFAMDTPSATS